MQVWFGVLVEQVATVGNFHVVSSSEQEEDGEKITY
jgi:hypothetical protein